MPKYCTKPSITHSSFLLERKVEFPLLTSTENNGNLYYRMWNCVVESSGPDAHLLCNAALSHGYEVVDVGNKFFLLF